MRLREDFAGCNIFYGRLYRSFAVVQGRIYSRSLPIFRLHPVCICELWDWYRVQTLRVLFSRHSLTLCSTNGAEGISESYLVHLLAPGGSIFCLTSSLKVSWGTHHNLHIPTVFVYLKLTCWNVSPVLLVLTQYTWTIVYFPSSAFFLIFMFAHSYKATLQAFLQNNISPSIVPWQFIPRSPIFPFAFLWSFSGFKFMQVTSLLINVPSKIFHFVMASSCILWH